MRTRRTIIILALVMLPSLLALGKDRPVRIFVDGVERQCRPPAVMTDGMIYIPLRGAADCLGARGKWNEKTSTAMITLRNKRVRISQDQGIMVGKNLLLPLRVMSEALDCEVKWDGRAKAVRISGKAWCRSPG